MTGEFEQVRQAEPKTRQQRRQARVIARAERIKKSQEKELAETRPIKKRLIPIWLRLLIVAVLLVLSMIAGMIVGYGVIGDGKPMDALKISTWEHLVDLVVEGTKGKK